MYKTPSQGLLTIIMAIFNIISRKIYDFAQVPHLTLVMHRLGLFQNKRIARNFLNLINNVSPKAVNDLTQTDSESKAFIRDNVFYVIQMIYH